MKSSGGVLLLPGVILRLEHAHLLPPLLLTVTYKSPEPGDMCNETAQVPQFFNLKLSQPN